MSTKMQTFNNDSRRGTDDVTSSQKERKCLVGNETYNQRLLDLLNKPTSAEDTEADYRLGVVAEITNKLAVFGIHLEFADILVGPSVTGFVFNVLSQHTRMNDFDRFADDIKACVGTKEDVRIVVPVNGKRQVCIEVANRVRRPVRLRDVLESENFQKGKGNLLFAIGQGTDGKAVVADLSEMPHMLIAGSTGSGKSMALNCLIVSLMYRYSPDYVRFVMVDPKFVELSRYNGISYMLTDETITADVDALAAMDYLINEMNERFRLFRQKGVGNICEYNKSIDIGTTRLPYLVFIADELSDLMVACKQSFECKLQRLAQMSRAAGIHIVLATQRPDVKTITGTIKANMPCRMALKVSSSYDSMTVISWCGAEKLLGRGDMLCVLPDLKDLLRVQGAYVSNEEIRAIVDCLRMHSEAHFDRKIAYDIFVSQRRNEEFTSPAEICEQYIKFKLTADGKGYRVFSQSERTPTDVDIPSCYQNLPVTKIGEGAFLGCNIITSVTVPDGVNSIGEEAFAYCNNLTAVTVPNGIASIHDLAFFGCNGLKDVYYSGTQKQWQQIQIGAGNESLINATVHFKQ